MSPSVANQTPAMRTAVQGFISSVSERSGNAGLQIAILGFDGRKEMIDMLDPKGRAAVAGQFLKTQDKFFSLTKNNVKEMIDYIGAVKMGIEIPDNDYSTNLNGAVTNGLSLLDSSTALVNVMVLFTDGKDQAGLVSKDDAIAKATASKSKGVIVFGTFLRSNEQSSDLINTIATPSYAYTIDDINQLAVEFEHFATFIGMVCSNVYVYMYCSPKRGGIAKIQMYFNGSPATPEHTVDASTFDVSNGVCTKVYTPFRCSNVVIFTSPEFMHSCMQHCAHFTQILTKILINISGYGTKHDTPEGKYPDHHVVHDEF